MRAIQLQMFNDFQRNVGQNEQISKESKAWHKDQQQQLPHFKTSLNSPFLQFIRRRSYAFLLQNTLFLL